jgi:GTP-binding protein EngB required for normal cell division
MPRVGEGGIVTEGIEHERSERLKSLADMAAEVGAEALGREASELAERLSQGRFFVACVGQFKRGKSTLLNALIGRAILPTGVVPVTTAVTVLRYGQTVTAWVRYSDGRQVAIDPERLPDYVSEARNPENHKGVTAVEVTVPSRLLASGMCLVDTPGLGSVFVANTAATRAFVPHVDAALVVLGTDPPISLEELKVIREVSANVVHFVMVLNKSDRVTEADSQETIAFTRRVLVKHLDCYVGEIYRVSATERLAGHETRDWSQLEQALRDLAGQSGAVLAAAATRGLARIAGALLRDLEEQRLAMTRPIEDSQRRLAALRQAIVEAEYAMRELSARLKVEHVALSSRFGGLRREFLAGAGPRARRELSDAVHAAPMRRGPACRANAIDLAHEVARRRVAAWAQEIEPRAEALYTETMGRFVELANEFGTRLSSDSSGGMILRREEFFVERGFRQGAQFFFTSLLSLTAPGFWTWVLDWIRPRTWLVASAIRQASQYLDHLITTNSARVANDLTARVEESQHRLESEIRSRLSALVTTAQRALERARVQQASGAEAVRTELARIDELGQQLKSVIEMATH